LASIEGKPSLRGDPEFPVSTSVFVAVSVLFFALDRFKCICITKSTRDKGRSINIELEGHLGNLGGLG
jgi:hypothetical protein